MRVLALYYTHKPGGFCKRLYRLLNGLSARDEEVRYLSLDEPPATLSPAVSWQRIPFPLRARSGLPFWALFTVWCPIYAAWHARSFRPERFVAFGAYYSCMLALAARCAGAPLILFARSLVFRTDELTGKPKLLRYFTRAADRIGLKRADRVICLTNAMRSDLESFLGRPLPSVRIVPNDLPPPKQEQPAPELRERGDAAIVALTAGVLNRGKNVELILGAFEILERHAPGKARLLICGSGESIPGLRERARGKEWASFLGWQNEMGPIYAGSDLLIHASLAEGMPNAVLEALAEKLIVLASDIPEHRELLCHDELLFDSNDPRDLARKLEGAISSSATLRYLKDLSAQRAERLSFDWEAECHKALLEE